MSVSILKGAVVKSELLAALCPEVIQIRAANDVDPARDSMTCKLACTRKANFAPAEDTDKSGYRPFAFQHTYVEGCFQEIHRGYDSNLVQSSL